MYFVAFRETVGSPTFALVLTGLFVIVCQLKINVTNAYAGSIAWSNFFSRLTHSHPGRVVWLVFNVVLALVLMEIGIFHAIDGILRIYANFAAGWIGALTADLVINKPLGLSPPYIEFRRAYLYDVNPVGVGALLLSIVTSSLAYLGVFGSDAADPVAVRRAADRVRRRAADRLGDAAVATTWRGQPTRLPPASRQICAARICENVFERADMALVPGLLGTDLLAVLHAGIALPRCLQAARPRRAQLAALLEQRAAGARRGGAQHARRPFRRHPAGLQSGHRPAAVAHLPPIQRRCAGGARDRRRPRCGWCS